MIMNMWISPVSPSKIGLDQSKWWLTNEKAQRTWGVTIKNRM